ncbi:MAG: hypothetical protein WD231_02420 [Candidatus Woykebacteria bacterium]
MQEETESSSSGSNLCGGLFWAVVIIGGLIWFGNKVYRNNIESEKKPFWSGTETVQVCKAPYYSSSDCYKLPVTLIDEERAQIRFNNGGYVVVGGLNCWNAAKLDETPRYVFCRSEDNEGNRWDFLPNWVNY